MKGISANTDKQKSLREENEILKKIGFDEDYKSHGGDA